MGNSEPLPGSWSILPSGIILVRSPTSGGVEGEALCVAAVSCATGAALTLRAFSSRGASCAVLNGSRIHFPACGLCADPEGDEFAVTLASCTSDGTFGFRADYSSTAAAMHARPPAALRPVPLSAVRLQPNQDRDTNEAIFGREARNLQYLTSLNITKLACPFTGGLLGPAPSELARCSEYSENHGHWFQGHWLSAAAHGAAATGNTTLRLQGSRMVGLLAKCQRPDGYLGAWPSAVFDDLEAGGRLRDDVSVPFYDVHKMFAGLLDQHMLQRNEQALRMAEGLAGYFLSRIERVIAVNGTARWQDMLCVEWVCICTPPCNDTHCDMRHAYLTGRGADLPPGCAHIYHRARVV